MNSHALRSDIEYYERQLRYVTSYSEERSLLERVSYLRNQLKANEQACYMPPLLAVSPLNICNRALLTASVPEKTMKPKTNENAAIAVLEAKLAEHKKTV